MRFNLKDSSKEKREAKKVLDEHSMITEENIHDCLQCAKCSSGCPAGEFMDLYPHQVLLYAKLGLFEPILNSKSIWMCASCLACGGRCPQGIDPAKVMDGFKVMAIRKSGDDSGELYPFKVGLPRQAFVGYSRKYFR